MIIRARKTQGTVTASRKPRGSVTLMFTDIEGSTKLLQRLRERYAVVLEDHRDLLRAAFDRHDGYEVDTQGDSFLVAFGTAIDAVECALEIQRAVAAHEWPDKEVVRVRIGIHTGEPAVASTGYIGIDVHRGARLGAAAHGGQVVVSAATRERVNGGSLAETVFAPLGMFRFKGLTDPLTVFEVRAPGLLTEFPGLRTSAREDEPPSSGEPPYQGLLRFDEHDAARFFGREALVAQITQTIRDEAFFAVIGASGSGKSSLVRAGVIPAFGADEAGSATERWSTVVTTPTADPLGALAVGLSAQLPDRTNARDLRDRLTTEPAALSSFVTRPTILIVDQFEELFTLCNDDAARRAFVAALGASARDRLHVLITLRADFYAELAEFPELRAAVAEHQVYIGPMDAAELRRAIEEPARLGGWDIAPGLVDLLLRDIGTEPGALPLLSHALLETWRRRRGSQMTLKGYFESGGVRGAIARTADRLYTELPQEDQTVAREILLRLTELGEGTQDTRRRASLRELIRAGQPNDQNQATGVLRRLVDARLVTVDEGAAEVAHEALIREWPLLRTWLHEDREGLRIQRQITEAAADWHASDSEPSLLYRGARLAIALEWATANGHSIATAERAFLDASAEAEDRAERERVAQQQRELEAAQRAAAAERLRAEEQVQANRRLRRRAVFLASAVVLAVGLGLTAFVFAGQASDQATQAKIAAARADDERAVADNQRQIAQQRETEAQEQRSLADQRRAEADDQRRTALSRQLAAQAATTINGDLDVSLLLSLEALHADDTLEARASLLSGLLAEPQLDTLLETTTGLAGAGASEDGRTLVVASRDGDVRVWDVQARKLVTEFSSVSDAVQPTSVSVSTHGEVVALGAGSETHEGVVEVRTLPQGLLRTTITGCGWGRSTLSPDGNTVVVDCGDAYALFDTATGTRRASLCAATDVRYSPDSMLIAAACVGAHEGLFLYNAATGAVTSSLTAGGIVRFIAFSEDGARLAETYRTSDPDESGSAASDVFVVWTLGPEPRSTIVSKRRTSKKAKVPSFVGNDRVLTLGDEDLELWDVATPMLEAESTCPTGFDDRIQVNRAKSLIAVACDGIEVLELPGLSLLAHLNPPAVSFAETALPLQALSFVADSSELASVTYNRFSQVGYLALWDPSRHDRLAQPIVDVMADDAVSFSVSRDFTRAIAFVSSGETAGAPEGVALVDVASRTHVADFALPEAAPPTPFGCPRCGDPYAFLSAQGQRLAFGSVGANVLTVADSATGTIVASFSVSDPGVMTATLSPDGSRIAIGGADVTSVWDVNSQQKLFSFDHPNLFAPAFSMERNMAFSPDADTLAVINDTTVELWDVTSGKPIGSLAGHHDAPISTVVFSADGRILATGSHDQSVALWDVQTRAQLGQRLRHHGEVFSMAFSPDGLELAVSEFPTWETTLWNVPLQREVGHLSTMIVDTFNADGTRLAALRPAAGVEAWNVDPQSWQREACQVANRNLTLDEWTRYLGDEPYRATCVPLDATN